MVDRQRVLATLRSRFDEVYDSHIVGGGFFESDEYYKFEKERYWRSLEYFCRLDIPSPARILEIGGGNLALLCKMLFGDDCTVADISEAFNAPFGKAGIKFFTYSLMDPAPNGSHGEFDVVILLEVIEHIPVPGHVVIERVKPFLSKSGILFLTTRNLFRIRNMVRMILGIEFLDHFMMPVHKGHGLGHQVEYSAKHLQFQLEHAGMQVILVKEDTLGASGHSFKARLARVMMSPLELRPRWRDGLVAAARKENVSKPVLSESSAVIAGKTRKVPA